MDPTKSRCPSEIAVHEPALRSSERSRAPGANALALASNLEKFTAQEHIEYAMLDRSGIVEEYDSGSFDYVYSLEQQKGGTVSREYRTPVRGGPHLRPLDSISAKSPSC